MIDPQCNDRTTCEHTNVLNSLRRIEGKLMGLTGWMTIAEAERYAHVAHGAIRQAVRTGEIASYRRKDSRTTIVATSDVDAWIRTTWTSGEAMSHKEDGR